MSVHKNSYLLAYLYRIVYLPVCKLFFMNIRLFLFFIFLSLSPCLVFANGKKITKIVLDAGHGGKDNGAKGKFSLEKNLTLAVVKKLGRIMADSMRDVQVIYTRTTDDYPSLQQRHEIANKANADLFVAVHVNSTADKIIRDLVGYKTTGRGRHKKKIPKYRVTRIHETEASGTETYVLGLKRNGQKEKAIGEYGDNIVEEPGLLNENDPMTAIIISQYSQAFLSRSVLLATKIQQEYAAQGRGGYGVKQMSLEVLAGSAMPGILTEIGFINNPEEERMLNSEEGQWNVAMAIFRGIKAYKVEVERQ
jgi:N-acetylmuramoyl-L-alanine amidase